jgi:uncharacterized peroxidase-related enzyme
MQPERESNSRAAGGGSTCGAANLATVDEPYASEEVLALYQEFRAKFGRKDVPGILRCFGTHPPLLRAMMDLASGMLFVDGALTRKQKEMIATCVSIRNACPYCADSHGRFFLEQGGSSAMLMALQRDLLAGSEFTDEEQVLLRFVEQVNEGSSFIRRADVELVKQAGWSDLQIAEAVHLVALFAAFNRTANAFGLPSQEPLLLDGKSLMEDQQTRRSTVDL